MHSQSWIATVVFAVIGFGGGYLAGHSTAGGGSPVGTGAGGQTDCYFSPEGGCTDAIVAELSAARHTIELQGYSFTSRPIGSALVAARQHGVAVTLVLDAAQASENRREVNYVARSGVPIYLDARHAIAHNKVILIDDRTVLTGSFNFTRAAERENAENLVVLHDFPKLQAAYEENFRRHLAHSQRYESSMNSE